VIAIEGVRRGFATRFVIVILRRNSGGTVRIRTGDYQLRRLVPYFPKMLV